MKKLYKATYEVSVVFFTKHTDQSILSTEAHNWLRKQMERNIDQDNSISNSISFVTVNELTSLDDLPKGWSLDLLPWGQVEVCADECTVGGWFENQQEEKLAKIESLKAEIAKLTDELSSLGVHSQFCCTDPQG